MRQTIAQSLIEGLTVLGYKLDPRKSGRYQAFVHATRPAIGPNGKPVYLFVGRNGALRRGLTVTQSLVCSDAFRLQILEAKPKAMASMFTDL